MKTKKILAIVLASLMVMFAFASCGETSSNERPPDGDGGHETVAADYNGEPFTFAKFTSSTESGTEYYCGNWLDAEEINGVATNDAVWSRNNICEKMYNVDIQEEVKGEAYEDLNRLYMMGDFTFDVVYGWASRMSVGVTEKGFHDFRDLDDNNYIDMSASYWSPEANEGLTIAGRTFLAINDITMSKLSWSGCMFFNPQIVTDYKLDDPHALVNENKWTVDKFLEMVSSVHGDIDGSPDFTQEDQYGLVDLGTISSLIYGCNVNLVDDNYQLAIGSQKVIDLIENIRKVTENRSYCFDYGTITNGADTQGLDSWQFTRSYFANGHSLFITGNPELTREFNNMEDSYGVVPLPKYNENQENYVSCIDPAAGIFAIPFNEKRIDDASDTSSYERTGVILDYLAFKSSQEDASDTTVLDAYYETTIKNQRQTIEANKDMLEIVRNSGRYEWARIFSVGGDGKSISDTLGSMIDSKGIMSAYKKSATRLQKAIDNFYAEIEALP